MRWSTERQSQEMLSNLEAQAGNQQGRKSAKGKGVG